MIRFISDPLVNNAGFRVEWNCNTATNIESLTQNNPFSVFPNPFNEKITLSYALQEASAVEITMADITGRAIQSYSSRENAGRHYFTIDKILPDGIYLIHLVSGKESYVVKAIKYKQ
jgi:hypothetical protein